MIYAEFIPHMKRYFEYPNFLGERILLFGFQDIAIHPVFTTGWSDLSWRRRLLKIRYWLNHRLIDIPSEFELPTLTAVLKAKGSCVDEIDLFDQRATIHLDMNHPMGPSSYEQYNTLIDIGSLEHVFDTRQAIDNCFRMIKVGGYYLLSTPVKGYFGHGFHTFNPDALRQAITLNGFEICDEMFTDRFTKMRSPGHRFSAEASIWLLARKLKPLDAFVIPQQRFWVEFYGAQTTDSAGVMKHYREAL